MLGFLVQLQRLVTATKVGCVKPYHIDVKKALSKMRMIQVGFTMIHIVGVSISFFVTVGVLQPFWFVFLILLSAETLATTFTFVIFAWSRIRNERKKLFALKLRRDKEMQNDFRRRKGASVQVETTMGPEKGKGDTFALDMTLTNPSDI